MKNKNLHEAKRWLKQAEHDFKVAKWNAKGKFWAQACFMAQQSAEKGLKSFCLSRGERNVIGHSLLVLSKRCSKHEKSFVTLAEDCRRLDKFYIITRYPNGLPDLTPSEYFGREEAREAIHRAKTILDSVKKKVR